MNLECDDDKWTCPHCGDRHYPEVGMSFCGCLGSYTGNRFDSDPAPKKERSYSLAYGGYFESDSSYVSNPRTSTAPTKWIHYTHVQHKTEKATLFGFHPKDGGLNPVLLWVPNSCILNSENGRIKLKEGFYNVYIKSKIKRKQPKADYDH